MHPRLPVLIFLLGCLTATQAHDTWLRTLPPVAGAPTLALGTGNRFPVYETAVAPEYVERQGCNPGPDTTRLRPLHLTASSLVLKAEAGARSCWVQLVPLPIELAPDKVAIYLREIQAGPELRADWADMQRRGLAWTERYTKHARIDFVPGQHSAVPMAMDIVWEQASSAGNSFVVLRDGQPLAGFAVELQSADAAVGIWRRTDAQGRIGLPTLPAGRWLLRGTDLRRSDAQPDTWDSRFVTLAFDVSGVSPQAR